eukprot:1192674-Prorocentrum_minimum.AAC.2
MEYGCLGLVIVAHERLQWLPRAHGAHHHAVRRVQHAQTVQPPQRQVAEEEGIPAIRLGVSALHSGHIDQQLHPFAQHGAPQNIRLRLE